MMDSIIMFPGVLSGIAGGAVPIAYPGQVWDKMFNIWLIVAVAIYLIVAIPMLYFMVKYRYKKGVREEGAHIEGSTGLEVLWTVVPLIAVIYLATQGFVLYKEQRTAPPDSMVVRVEGFMWGWSFEYPNGKKTSDELYVPVGKPVKLLMTSTDVVHAFYVPQAKMVEDVVPGRLTSTWFQFNKTGDYTAFCREYCGTLHSYMLAT
ncbi:MAG: cytochrome c oxidase subunit II, partial [Nitrospirae bacterium]|nr:cytochrome c oxidase subunit II [Nitrospirota bacterium]